MTVFRVGQKVVCINDEWPSLFGSSPLIKGSVYTIIGTGISKALSIFGPTSGGFLVLILKETKNESAFDTIGFDANRFRPVAYPRQTEEADVALFKPALSPDPILICDLWERDFEQIEAALSRFDLP